MDKLTEARKIINSVDAEMAKLFCRRMAAVKDVLEYKREHGLPVLDTARENAVMEANSALIDDEALKEYYISFIRATMAVSREYQRSLLSGMRAAYCGVEGAFAQIAAKHIYADCEAKAYPSFAAAYAAVEEGECEVAVLPIENSSAGEVGQVVDLIFAGNLYINGVYELAVEQNLMALPGARLSDIKTVFSHPQALMQCAPFLEEKGMQTKAFENTAAAAKFVSESGDRTVAAIASDETAKLYGLEIIERDINSERSNTTRFAAVSRVRNDKQSFPSGQGCVLMFAVKNEAGALAEAINIIGSHGFNMRSIHSRPQKDTMWQYYFYAELEGDVNGENGRAMLAELEGRCDRLKLAGTFGLHMKI